MVFRLIVAFASLIAAFLLHDGGHVWLALATGVLAIVFAAYVLRDVRRLRLRVNYLISAAMNGDFSCKFPTSGVSGDERDINRQLNLLVSHLEQLSDDARQNEAFLSCVINLVDSGIIVANGQGHIVHVNDAALALLSLPVLTDVRQLPEDMPGLKVTRTETVLHSDRLTIYTVSDMRRQLQTAEVESWEKLTRVLTHEIMNSLTPVNSIAENICTNHAGADGELAQQLDVIRSSSRSLMEFVKNFRRFTVLPAPQARVFYIKPFLERIILLVRSFDGAADLDVSLSVFPPDAMAYSDENMLAQVIVNILKNALEAHPSHVRLSVAIRNDESVEIAIANDGDPIPDDIAGQIFTPFFSTKAEGSGIGLSLSRRIIAKLGGTLTLTASPVTKFTIIL